MKNENDALAFSGNFVQARQRFLAAAGDCGIATLAFPISAQGAQGEDLSMDVAVVGDKDPQNIILLTSGIHGVEGFLGSAVQTAWLQKVGSNQMPLGRTAVVLVHALNPYGFSWIRRANENNVDLIVSKVL